MKWPAVSWPQPEWGCADELCEWQAEYVFGGKLLRLRLRLL
jgi:hypothetical protein